MECNSCKKQIEKYSYIRSYPLLITKRQEEKGVLPTGDFLIRVCEECHKKGDQFHNPEFPPV